MADTRSDLRVDVLRSPLGRVRGLGSARSGARHWWMERITALALVPLTLWFICAAIRLTGASRVEVADWLASPWTMALMLALVVATSHHLQLGLQVVIEDYVHHDQAKMILVLAVKGLSFLLAAACIVSTLRLGL
jgi:succinate dehydrogenase / fumarate reductase membrane anchor subunit